MLFFSYMNVDILIFYYCNKLQCFPNTLTKLAKNVITWISSKYHLQLFFSRLLQVTNTENKFCISLLLTVLKNESVAEEYFSNIYIILHHELPYIIYILEMSDWKYDRKGTITFNDTNWRTTHAQINKIKNRLLNATEWRGSSKVV